MVKIRFMLLAVIMMHFNGGCKPKKVLPETTQEGLNTFGVKIDGKVWLPVQEISITGGGRMLRASIYDDVLGIVAKKRNSDEEIQLVAINVKSVGSYKLKESDSGGIEASKYDGDLVNDDYFPYPGGVNEINITKLDTINQIVSGTFKVQLKGKNSSAIKNFTQGIFDLRYEH